MVNTSCQALCESVHPRAEANKEQIDTSSPVTLP